MIRLGSAVPFIVSSRHTYESNDDNQNESCAVRLDGYFGFVIAACTGLGNGAVPEE